ncbi:MAG TPA: peptidylprolyl isomerase [bacterium]|nr:peptidylprolyl isomerase [bacterium]
MLVSRRIQNMTVATLTALLLACVSQTGLAGPQVTKMTPKEPSKSTVDPAKTYEAVIETDKGNIKVKLYAKEAPLSVTNFVQLAKGGFYEGLTFHRVEPGFVIQGGDPAGNGTGGPGYTVPAEIGQPHLKGALAWARTGDEVNPQRRSSGSQFYITLEATPFLDGGYTVFGQTIEGMEVVGQIRKGDKIKKVTITEK